MKEKKNFIKDYITEEECNYMCDDIVFGCENCSCLEDCYAVSCGRCNNEWADSISYGGYDNAESFWDSFN